MTHPERTYRLLIVDDDETDRRLYGWLLARQAPGAFEIEQAQDGATGIAALRDRKFDCLLLDLSRGRRRSALRRRTDHRPW
jgi:CheY-like chemotaxis protein